MPEKVTYGQLYQLLLALEFIESTVKLEGPIDRTTKAYQHAKSGTMILLPNRRRNLAVRESDLISTRRHLVENGVIDDADCDRLISPAA